ncbi:MAG: NAD(P)H-dependent oxidoreductase [Cyclobacteriaceae bacterium]
MNTADISGELNESWNWRYATKKFDPDKKLDETDLGTILSAARMAPTSYGLQPFHLLAIRDEKLRNRIHSEASAQAQIIDSQVLVIFSVPENVTDQQVDSYIDLLAEQRDMDPAKLQAFASTIKGSISSMSVEDKQNWSAKQAYLAQGFLLQAAALLKVDACPMEGFDQAKLRNVLPNHQAKLPVVMVALGYRSDEDKYAKLAKVRKGMDDLLTVI